MKIFGKFTELKHLLHLDDSHVMVAVQLRSCDPLIIMQYHLKQHCCKHSKTMKKHSMMSVNSLFHHMTF